LTERHYPLTPKYNETRKGLQLSIDGGKQEFTPEELTAMVLHYAEEITHHYGKEKGNTYGDIQDCVLTVPSFATQAERQALLDSATLAGFKVLSLIDENTASALNFGMDKSFEEPQIYLFYNLGASSLQVSIIKYHSYEVPESKYSKKMKRVGSIEVIGKGWDSTLGGIAIDSRVVDYMADHFNREWRKARGHEKDIRDVPRAMTKIRLQANKIKHVLSANSEIPVHMDALHDDMALSLHFTRAQLEELCDDLMGRAVAPVHQALKAANLTLDDVTAIELIGGGMRVPKVQSGLGDLFGEKELGMHINSDESMALGAAFFGANISTAFRVRQVGLVDINPFPIAVSLEDIDASGAKGSEDGEEGPWSKQATIFKANGKIGVKKTIAFTHEIDVHCSLDYAEPESLPEGAKPELQRYKITGVSEFAKEMEEKGLGKPKVSLQFELSQSGITSLLKAEAAVEETYTVEVEVEVDDDEEEGSEGNETTAEESKERKTEETALDDGEGKEKGEEDSAEKDSDETASEEGKNETATGDEDKNKKKETKKKKTKLVEKVRSI
jgi:hypoxia up-regulated 1